MSESRSCMQEAERELKEIKNTISRLSAGGIVRQRLEVALSCIEAEISTAAKNAMETNDFVVVDHGKAGKEPVTTATVAEGIEFCEAARISREKLEKALSHGESNRPVDEKEALTLCIHALIACRSEGYPALRCVGVPCTSEKPVLTGFAPPVRELDRGKLLPKDWQRIEPGVCGFKYRRDGYQDPQAAEVFELRSSVSHSKLHVTISSAARGLLHEDCITIGFLGDVVPAARFEAAAEYVRNIITPRLHPPHSSILQINKPESMYTATSSITQEERTNRVQTKNILSVDQKHRDIPVKCGRPDFDLPRPPRTAGGAPFFMDPDENMLVGPSHPGFGGGTMGAVPRYDPMTPGDLPPGPIFPPGHQPPPHDGRFLRGPPGRGQRLPGEPNFDHLKPPGSGGDDSMFL